MFCVTLYVPEPQRFHVIAQQIQADGESADLAEARAIAEDSRHQERAASIRLCHQEAGKALVSLLAFEDQATNAMYIA